MTILVAGAAGFSGSEVICYRINNTNESVINLEVNLFP
jgi:dTDP-D-glucose 4,6-dehydratase